MNHEKNRTGIVLMTGLCLLMITSFSLRAFADIKAEVNKLLSEIAVYEFGQSREPLSQMSDLIRSAFDSPDDLRQIQQSMLKALNSDATFAGKQFICQQLSLIGTEEAIPTLLPMLKNAKTSDMARYALERIPGAAVDSALREALSETSGKVKVGIINTLGERRDLGSVEVFGKLIYDSDPLIASAAASALGKIADQEAIRILAEAEDKTSGGLKLTVLDAYLLCADKLARKGEQTDAAAIYKQVFESEQSPAIKAAALRGMINTAGDDAPGLILDVMKKGEPHIQAVAIDMVRELPDSQTVTMIAEALPELSDTGKIQLLSALTDRGDIAVRQTVSEATQDEREEVRVAALKALAKLGNETDIDLLARAAANSKGAEKETARESLARLSGPKVDQTILSSIAHANAEIKVELIQSVGARNMTTGVETLFKTANDPNENVRVESFKSLELVADQQHLPVLIDLLINVKSESERKRAERAVVATARKASDEKNQAQAVIKKLPSVSDMKAKGSLLEVLGRIGDRNALPILQTALNDEAQSIQEAAIHALSDWPTPEPMPDLLNVAKTSKNEMHQVLALRGYIHLIGLESDRPADETIELYKTAMKLASNVNEKRMVLSGLASVHSLSALEMSAKYLKNKELQEEAEVAIVKIADRIRRDHPDKAKATLNKVLDKSKNEQNRKDAQKIIDRINNQ